jgi:hypothetical protein
MRTNVSVTCAEPAASNVIDCNTILIDKYSGCAQTGRVSISKSTININWPAQKRAKTPKEQRAALIAAARKNFPDVRIESSDLSWLRVPEIAQIDGPLGQNFRSATQPSRSYRLC